MYLGAQRGKRKERLAVITARFALLFTPSLRTNDYLVEDDPISPREKVIRSVLIGLL